MISLSTIFSAFRGSEQWVIYRLDTPEMMVMCIDGKGVAQYTTNPKMACIFESSQLAQRMTIQLDEPVSFFGTRPIRY
jgi:hypothetical protein